MLARPTEADVAAAREVFAVHHDEARWFKDRTKPCELAPVIRAVLDQFAGES
jgi:hypothetical protein